MVTWETCEKILFFIHNNITWDVIVNISEALLNSILIGVMPEQCSTVNMRTLLGRNI